MTKKNIEIFNASKREPKLDPGEVRVYAKGPGYRVALGATTPRAVAAIERLFHGAWADDADGRPVFVLAGVLAMSADIAGDDGWERNEDGEYNEQTRTIGGVAWTLQSDRDGEVWEASRGEEFVALDASTEAEARAEVERIQAADDRAKMKGGAR